MNKIPQWRDALERAILYDSWGQMLEAATEYDALAQSVQV